MIEATEEARQALDGIVLQWVLVEKTGDPEGKLPDPVRALPSRDPETLSEDPVAKAYRELSWRLDVDPTKERPAGEALARRVAQGKGLPAILPLVDAYNLASAATLVPFSAFDLERTEGPLRLDVAQADETLVPIGGDTMDLTAGRPVWRDRDGPVGVFLYRDGQRTALGDGSERAVIVAAGPGPLAPRILPSALRTLESYVSVVGWRFAKGPEKLTL